MYVGGVIIWFKRMMLLAWFIATCLFTIDANEVEGIENNIAADIVAAILLFNLIPWLITYRRRQRRKSEQQAALNPAGSVDQSRWYLSMVCAANCNFK